MLPMANMETVIFYTTFIPMGAMYLHQECPVNLLNDFNTRGWDVFTCKNVLNTRSYDFYTLGWDEFTCKNILNTRS